LPGRNQYMTKKKRGKNARKEDRRIGHLSKEKNILPRKKKQLTRYQTVKGPLNR